MSKVKSKDTSIEIALRKVLWKRGLRYRKNYTKLIGKPDIVFLKAKVVVFCDSEFWHGKQYSDGKMPKTNIEFWETKFKRNIQRDNDVNLKLKKDGWIVLRFWQKEIHKDVLYCADIIENTLITKLNNK
jgi:DNA mismatch endonuclease (patch repair protein)